MTVETGTTIADLDNNWPLNTDPVNEGDDHIRLIKSILKTQFPGAGSGYATPITATEAELNALSGVTGNVQSRLNALEALLPAGTILLFGSTPPPGWSLVDNTTARNLVVSNSPNSTGGSEDAFSFSKNHFHATAGHTLTLSELPAHRHRLEGLVLDFSTTLSAPSATRGGYNADSTIGGSTTESVSDLQGGGNSHDHGNTLDANVSWAPRYRTVVMAEKQP